MSKVRKLSDIKTDVTPNRGDPTRLSPRHKVFADEYLRCYSPTKAARKAGYSEASVSQAGYQLIRRDDVSAYIEAHLENRRKVVENVPFDIIVAELTELALDPDRDMKDRMKASDLLMKWQSSNKWSDKENADVDKYVEALKEERVNIWEGE